MTMHVNSLEGLESAIPDRARFQEPDGPTFNSLQLPRYKESMLDVMSLSCKLLAQRALGCALELMSGLGFRVA